MFMWKKISWSNTSFSSACIERLVSWSCWLRTTEKRNTSLHHVNYFHVQRFLNFRTKDMWLAIYQNWPWLITNLPGNVNFVPFLYLKIVIIFIPIKCFTVLVKLSTLTCTKCRVNLILIKIIYIFFHFLIFQFFSTGQNLSFYLKKPMLCPPAVQWKHFIL